MGTPVAAAAAVMPCAHAEAMYSKCGVAPLIRHPRQTTAPTRPVSATRCAAIGILESARHAQDFDVAAARPCSLQHLLRALEQTRR